MSRRKVLSRFYNGVLTIKPLHRAAAPAFPALTVKILVETRAWRSKSTSQPMLVLISEFFYLVESDRITKKVVRKLKPEINSFGDALLKLTHRKPIPWG